MQIVVDTNLIIAALNADDCQHAEAKDLIRLLGQLQYEILAPALALWEFYAYTDHPEKSKSHNQDAGINFQYTSIPVTQELFAKTYTKAMVAVTGADRVFISVAKYYGISILTNDKAILKNSNALGVRSISPTEFMRKFCRIKFEAHN